MSVTRFYLMRGLGGIVLSRGMDEIGTLLKERAPTCVVQVGDWSDMARFIEDAWEHKDDHIVFGGHSMGCKASFDAGRILDTRGLKIRVIGLDPLCTCPVYSGGFYATNIWGNPCGVHSGEVQGAQNIYAPGPTHIGYPSDPRIQKLFVTEALGPDDKK